MKLNHIWSNKTTKKNVERITLQVSSISRQKVTNSHNVMHAITTGNTSISKGDLMHEIGQLIDKTGVDIKVHPRQKY